MLTKECKKCKGVFSLVLFSPNSKGLYGRAQLCKSCAAQVTAEYRKQNHSKVYANKFKTTIEHVELILKKEICDICGARPKESKRNSIDHSHSTGVLRGLLCDDCNIGLGKFKDNIELMRKAIAYLQNTTP